MSAADPTRDLAPDLVEAFVASVANDRTAAAYRRDLELFVDHLGVTKLVPGNLDRRDLEAFRDALEQQGFAPSTVERRLASVGAFIRRHGGDPGPTPKSRRNHRRSASTPPRGHRIAAGQHRRPRPCRRGRGCAALRVSGSHRGRPPRDRSERCLGASGTAGRWRRRDIPQITAPHGPGARAPACRWPALRRHRSSHPHPAAQGLWPRGWRRRLHAPAPQTLIGPGRHRVRPAPRWEVLDPAEIEPQDRLDVICDAVRTRLAMTSSE